MIKSNLVFKLLLVSAVVFFISCYQNLNAQQNSDSSKVEAANQSFYKAFASEDIKAMEKVWSHSSYASSIHPISIDIIVGWEGVEESFVGVFSQYKNITIVPKDSKVHVEGNVAWVMDHEEFQAQMDGKTVNLRSAAINIFVKKSGKWLMIHHQATVPIKP